jgi:hypothetical protein
MLVLALIHLAVQNFCRVTVPPYAILSHTWGADADEVIFADLGKGDGTHKPGYKKIRFCGEQAQQDHTCQQASRLA